MPLPPNINDREFQKFELDENDDVAVRNLVKNGQHNSAIFDLNQVRYDAFGRLRSSQPNTIFEMSANGTLDLIRYRTTKTGGTGTVGIDANEPSFKLSVGTTSGDFAIMATRRKIHYFKSNSQHIYITGRFNSAQNGLRQRYGYFGNSDGLFFQLLDSTFSVVRRSSVTGVVVDDVTNQDSWNVDKLDGSGPSGEILDITKQFVFNIDFGWLGSLGVRFYIHIGMKKILVHQMNFANELGFPYMFSGFNSIRGEIENLANTVSPSDLFMTCSAVQSEGETRHPGTIRTIDSGTTLVALTGIDTVFTGLRISPQFIGHTSIKTAGLSVNATAGNNQIYYRVIYNPILVGAIWTPAIEGYAEVLSGNPTFSGGSILFSGYLDSAKSTSESFTFDAENVGDVWLGGDVDDNPDHLIVAARTISGSGSLLFTKGYREFY